MSCLQRLKRLFVLPPAISTKPRLRYIKEDWGGTLTVEPFSPRVEWFEPPKTPEEYVPLVGAYGCNTCVGLYLKISKERAYLAHINAYVHSGPYPEHVYPVNENQGQWLQEQVRSRLKEHASQAGWSASDVNRESMIMVCPKPFQPRLFVNSSGFWETEESDVKQTGWYVVEGIKDFLDLPSHVKPDTAHEGFVVNHRTGETELLPTRLEDDMREPHEALAKYALKEPEPRNLQLWRIGLGIPYGSGSPLSS